ncbi:LOW QUALITY PROTEIN: von Willebrand factor D and EGF domain-containing protein-like [Argopecten irradians]|uniref:LOW QUALITY PROTEIN: von Willebrand factor D and EGF domain-containing protein-like n=1 Tax=Argopecten irradians TaxID=31199 RepID=UPI00371FA152
MAVRFIVLTYMCVLHIHLLGFTKVIADPCVEGQYTIIDDVRRRPVFNPGQLCDDKLSPGWYRFLLNGTDAEIPTSCVESKSCGTFAPVWLRLPAEGLPLPGQIRNGEGCANYESCCAFSFPVVIKNCRDFFIYKLEWIYGCPVAYCAYTPLTTCSEGQIYIRHLHSCVDHIVEITKPVIRVKVKGSSISLNCTFHITNDVIATTSPTFHVVWYKGERGLSSIIRKTFRTETSDAIRVGSDVYAGRSITCAVQPVSGAPSGEISSDPYFLGVKIQDGNVTLTEDSPVQNLTWVSRLPILCNKRRRRRANSCGANLIFRLDSNSEDSFSKVLFSSCKIPLRRVKRCPRNICDLSQIMVGVARNLYNLEPEEYDITGDIFFQDGRLWEGALFKSYLTVYDLPSATCFAVSGVQLLTFNLRKERLRRRGTYVLFQSTDSKIEIHMRVRHCSKKGGLCICGVVLRYKENVVTIDMCRQNTRSEVDDIEVDFRLQSYGSGGPIVSNMKVLEGRNNRLIHILLNAEARVRLDINSGEMGIAVHVSGYYTGKAEGLCGPITSVDISSGPEVNRLPAPPTSANSWRFAPDRSYFDRTPAPSMANEFDVACDCSSASAGNPCPEVKPFVTSHPFRRFKDVTYDWWNKVVIPPDYRFEGDEDLSDMDIEETVSEAIASERCGEFVLASDIADTCAEYIQDKIQFIIEMCISMAMINNESSWKSNILRLTESICESTLVSKPVDMDTNLTRDSYMNVTMCPGNCYNNGFCSDGGCICYYGYQGVECLQKLVSTTLSTSTTSSTTLSQSTTTAIPTTTLITTPPTTTTTIPATTTPTTTAPPTTTPTTTTTAPTTTTPTTTTTTPTTTTPKTTTTIPTTTTTTTTLTTTITTTTTTSTPTTTTTTSTTTTTTPTTTTTTPTATTTTPTTTTTTPTTNNYHSNNHNYHSNNHNYHSNNHNYHSNNHNHHSNNNNYHSNNHNYHSNNHNYHSNNNNYHSNNHNYHSNNHNYHSSNNNYHSNNNNNYNSNNNNYHSNNHNSNSNNHNSNSNNHNYHSNNHNYHSNNHNYHSTIKTTTTPTTTTTKPTTTTTTPTTTTTTPKTTIPITTTTPTTTATTPTTITTTPTTTTTSPYSTKVVTTPRPVLQIPFTTCDTRSGGCGSIRMYLKRPLKNFSGGCAVRQVQFKDGVWVPSSNMERTVMRYINIETVECLLPQESRGTNFTTYQAYVFDSLGNRLSNMVSAVDNVCQTCTMKTGCSFRDNTCFIDNKCYRKGFVNTNNPCEKCIPARSVTMWSPRKDNRLPMVRLKQTSFSIIQGDTLYTRLVASDPEGSAIVYNVDRPDAYISRQGMFKWKSTVRSIKRNGSAEVFRVSVEDKCGGKNTIVLFVVQYQCGCKHHGECISRTVNYNRTANGYECNCPSSYTGSRCESRVSACTSNPCYHGVACVEVGDGFRCGQCPVGMTGNGITCDRSCASNPCFPGVRCTDLAMSDPGFTNNAFACGQCPPHYLGDGQRCQAQTANMCDRNVCSSLVTCRQTRYYPYYKCGACPYGYLGNGTTCTANTCKQFCPRNRICVSPGVCACRQGYTGFICHRPVCKPHCQNMGFCQSVNKCLCRPGYTGSNCETAYCNPPCTNNGVCVRHNKCQCHGGYGGYRCEIPVCNPPCQNGGACLPGNKCRCTPNYKGKVCKKPKCSPKCQNGGKCVSPGVCRCRARHRGPRCERAVCRFQCQNGGVCASFNRCKCRHGYHGRRCQFAHCRRVCLHGGRCVGVNHCTCIHGYTGRYCHRVKCTRNCNGRGYCRTHDKCTCRKGYYGPNCQYASCWPRCPEGQRCQSPSVCRCRRTTNGRICQCTVRTLYARYRQLQNHPKVTRRLTYRLNLNDR